jgi:hypothetical protein
MQGQNLIQEAEQMFRQALMLSELRSETAASTRPRILQRLVKLYATQNRKTESVTLAPKTIRSVMRLQLL